MLCTPAVILLALLHIQAHKYVHDDDDDENDTCTQMMQTNSSHA